MIDLKKYADIVDAVTSSTSKNIKEFDRRINHLDASQDVNVPRLLTASIGISGEVGEFNEHIKKAFFHGKDLDVIAIEKELGDIIWYWINACTAMNFDPNEVISKNVEKLKARHPNGEFNPHYDSSLD